MRSEIERLQKKLKINRSVLDIYSEISFKTNEQFVCELLNRLDQERSFQLERKRVKAAGFPLTKTLDDYNFSGIQIPDALTVETIKDVAFVENRENLIFYGNVGTGKTHLAIALGLIAIRKEKRVQFFTLHELVNRLVDAKERGVYTSFLDKLCKNDMLILDEWGYLPLHHEGARHVFEVVSRFYEQRSLIITTNLDFSHWKNFLFDEKLTVAILDRVIHYAHLLVFNRSSYRKEHSLMK